MILSVIARCIYPSCCRQCGCLVAQNRPFCGACTDKAQPVMTTYIAITKKYTLSVYAACAYQEPIRSLLLQKLVSDSAASHQLAHFVCEKFPVDSIKGDYFIPIPLHWTRYARRGFNQAHILARVLSKKTAIPVINFLSRNRRTMYQSRLDSDQRRVNLERAFGVRWRYKIDKRINLRDKHIVLIDDLMTTGATLEQAARALIKYKPASIKAIVACRAL